jgi:hypothetical protein
LTRTAADCQADRRVDGAPKEGYNGRRGDGAERTGMRRDENAVLAVRICGLAFAAVQLRSIMWWAASMWPWWWSVDAGDAAYHLPYLTGVGLGVGAFLLAHGLSGLAAPAEADGARDGLREALRLGVLVLGVYYALGLLVALSWLVRDLIASRHLAGFAWTEAMAVLILLVWPRAVVGCLRRRADPGPEAGSARKVVAAGLALAGLWLLVGSAEAVIVHVGRVVSGAGEGLPSIERRGALVDVAYAALAVAMAYWSGRIAQWLPTGGRKAASRPAGLGPSACLCVAVYLIGIYEVASHLAYDVLLDLTPRAKLLSPAVSLALSLVLKALLVVGAAWGVRALGRWLGRRAYAEEAAREGAAATATVVVQTGLLLAALRWLVRALSPLPYEPSRAVAPLAVGLVLLAFWAQIGRWLVGPAAADGEDLRARRTTALRPWLVLLGFFVSPGSLARTLIWVLAATHVLGPVARLSAVGFHGSVYPHPSFAWIAGLLLVLAADPLSRWLAYDSLFGRWSRMGRWADRKRDGSTP